MVIWSLSRFSSTAGGGDNWRQTTALSPYHLLKVANIGRPKHCWRLLSAKVVGLLYVRWRRCTLCFCAHLHAFSIRILAIGSCYRRTSFSLTCRRWGAFAIWEKTPPLIVASGTEIVPPRDCRAPFSRPSVRVFPLCSLIGNPGCSGHSCTAPPTWRVLPRPQWLSNTDFVLHTISCDRYTVIIDKERRWF